MAILPNRGRAAISNALKSLPLHFAWGTGDGAWTTAVPPEDTNASALMAEIGRRTAAAADYVVPDPAGSIEVSTGKFSLSPGGAPTKWLWIRANFDFADAPSSVVREVAVFSDTEIQAGLPIGQAYFSPSQVVNPGFLLYIEHITPIFRSPAIQENFEAVIAF